MASSPDAASPRLEVSRTSTGVRFAVHVQPRASRTELVGVHGGALRVRLQAVPVDGRANEALVEYLASRLGVPRRAVQVAIGQASRRKVVDVEGIAVPDVQQLLATGK